MLHLYTLYVLYDIGYRISYKYNYKVVCRLSYKGGLLRLTLSYAAGMAILDLHQRYTH